VAPPLIDRFGVVDGVLRLMALVVVVLVALDVVRVALARWTVLRPTRSWSADHRLRVVALAGFATLYLAGVALDDEPGPGGALCATGLGLLGLAVVVAPLVARVRP
jgi:hypothetical protein